MGGRGEPTHVDPDLGDDRLGGDLADADHGAQALNLALERGHLDLQALVEGVDLCTQVVDVVEVGAQHEGVVLAEAALQGEAQLGEPRPGAGEGHLGQHVRVALAGDQGLDHVTRAIAEHIGDDRVELDAGVLQDLLDPLGLPGPLLGELFAISGQVTQAAHHRVGDEAAPQQTALEQRSKPLGIGDVGLSPREVLHMLSVAEQELEVNRL